MSAHTPGPWRYLEDHDGDAAGRPLTICDSANNDLASVYSCEDATVDISREAAIANARLIAAAPELFAAANMLWGRAIPRSERVEGPVTHYSVDRDEMMALRAAIAKATGAA